MQVVLFRNEEKRKIDLYKRSAAARSISHWSFFGVFVQVWLHDLASAARTHNHVTEGPPFYHPAMHVHYFTTATDKGGSSRGVDVGQEDMQQKSDVTQNLRAKLRTQASL